MEHLPQIVLAALALFFAVAPWRLARGPGAVALPYTKRPSPPTQGGLASMRPC